MDPFEQTLHVRLDHGADQAAHQREHAHHGEQFRARPAAELVGAPVHQREHHQTGTERQAATGRAGGRSSRGTASRSWRRREGRAGPNGRGHRPVDSRRRVRLHPPTAENLRTPRRQDDGHEARCRSRSTTPAWRGRCTDRGVRIGPTSAVIGKPKVQRNGRNHATSCAHARHQRHRHETAREQHLGDEIGLVQAPHARRPERHHAEHPQQQRTDEISAPDGEEEHDALRHRRVRVRAGRSR